jgi:hypothetical protein
MRRKERRPIPIYEQHFAFGQAMLTLCMAIELTHARPTEFRGVSHCAVGDREVGNNYPKAVCPKHLNTPNLDSRARR